MDAYSNYVANYRGKKRGATRKKAYANLQQTRYGRKAKSAAKKTYRKAKQAKRIIPVLSKCAVDYLKAQYDPWNLNSAPCIPDLIQLPSFKMMTRIRGTFRVGTLGTGGISMNPFSPANSVNTGTVNVNYLAPVLVTNTNLVATTLTYAAALDAGVAFPANWTPLYWNSTLSGDAVRTALDAGATGAQWRPVGGGIKVKYAGPADQMAGTYNLWEDPTNSDTLYRLGAFDPSVLLQREETGYTAITPDEAVVCYHQRNMSDMRYSDDWYQTAPSAANGNSQDTALYHTLGVFIAGAPASAPFAFDCVMHWEFTGSNFPSRTASDADPSGFAKVQNTFTTQPSTKSASDQLKDAAKELLKSAAPMAGQFANAYVPGAGAIVNSMLGG